MGPFNPIPWFVALLLIFGFIGFVVGLVGAAIAQLGSSSHAFWGRLMIGSLASIIVVAVSRILYYLFYYVPHEGIRYYVG